MQHIVEITTKPKSEALQAYYTDAEELNDLMISLLGDVSNKTVLEPCVGKGAFIRPLVDVASRIDAVDIDIEHVEEVGSLKSESLHVHHGDFIDHFVSDDMFSSLQLEDEYDALICNPPYGLKFSIEYRKKIKKRFPDVYARESYGLFMTFGISALGNGGRFVFIVPDTFLTSKNHTPLRRFLERNANITHLVQFNSSRFETVNFGYGSMCIIAGNRARSGQRSSVSWLDLRESNDAMHLSLFAEGDSQDASALTNSVETGWTVKGDDSLKFRCETKTLGELAECRTGIYTGDNARFCGFDAQQPPRRTNGHPIDWLKTLVDRPLTEEEKQHGISNGRRYVPFIRGGHRLPYEKTASALDWGEDAVRYYREDKKARLQNATFYFRRGLAVPMVTSGRLSASAFDGAVFDQGVVGVFPKEEGLYDFLLIFLNSDHATELKKSINSTANNSANYIKRITVPIPNEKQLSAASQLVRSWMEVASLDKNTCSQMATDFVAAHFSTI